MSKLAEEARRRGVRIPVKRTLAIYGLTVEAWLGIMQRQGWKCPICLKTEALWNLDHQHVPGWKKMPPEQRAKYVRGILCWYDNKRHAPSNMSAADAKRLAAYLEKYEARRKGTR